MKTTRISCLVLHAAEAAEAGAKRLVVLSADNDILVLMLYYWSELERKCLNELLFKAIGRYITIHKLALKLCADFSKVRCARSDWLLL